jgi:hypothetical protein
MNFENFKTTHNRPAKFTGEAYGIKISIDHDHSDLIIDEMMDAFETIAIGLGYHKDSWKQWIIDRADEYRNEEFEENFSFEFPQSYTADDFKRDEEEFENLRHGYEDREKLEDDFFGRYNEPETQKRVRALRDAELGIKDGYRATEEDEAEFDDYGMRIPEGRVTFEWGDEPEDDEPLFDGEEFELNENLKAANERYKSEVKKMNTKQTRNK